MVTETSSVAGRGSSLSGPSAVGADDLAPGLAGIVHVGEKREVVVRNHEVWVGGSSSLPSEKT